MEKKKIKKITTNKKAITSKKNQSKKPSNVAKKSKVSLKNKTPKTEKFSQAIKTTEEYFEKRPAHSSFNFLGFLNDFAQALIIVAVFILLTISFIIVGGQKKTEEFKRLSNQGYFNFLDDVKIVEKNKDFFGSLNFSSGEKDSSLIENNQESKVLGLGTAGAGNAPVIAVPRDISLIEEDIIIDYPKEIVEYNYVYVGDDFNLLPSEVNVYRRSNLDLSRQFADLFSDKKISFFDLKKFKNIAVNNLTINEDREYGYSIYLGLKDGYFSLYKNWEKWPSIEKECEGYDQDCYKKYQLTVNDILSDEEIINITDNFLERYDISLDNYGPGEVQKNWMRSYVLSDDKASFYLPDSIMVIYPLKLEGVDVYEESGQKAGLNVEVDIREKKAAGIHNLFYQHYERSAYNSEDSKENILKMVENGGIYPSPDYYRDDLEIKTIDIQVGTPTIGMVRAWHYDNEAMRGYEVYVPAYVFPIISESEPSYFYRKNIVIPAVKDFFNNNRVYALPVINEDLVDSDIDIDNE